MSIRNLSVVYRLLLLEQDPPELWFAVLHILAEIATSDLDLNAMPTHRTLHFTCFQSADELVGLVDSLHL